MSGRSSLSGIGSIEKTGKKNTWRIRVSLGKDPVTGKYRKSPSRTVHGTKSEAAKALMEKLGYAPQALKRGGIVGILAKAEQAGMAKLAAELGVGEMTLRDIASELEKPGRDPRDELPAPVLRTDVLSMEDLKPGMELTGTVRNVIDFGAFVDIGVHQDGLVHISRMADKFIRHPSEVVRVGDVVTVWVVDVDVKKQRIALSMVKGRT